MKKLIYTFIAAAVLTSAVYAQNRAAVGIVSTRFSNISDSYKLTEIKNPIGYGIAASYSLSKELSLAVTGEYFKGNLENNNGTERDLRGNISAFLTPFSFAELRPYISGGIVYSIRRIEYLNQNSAENVGRLNARFSAGVDYRLIQNLFINLDLGIYNNGLNIVGWSSSAGLRYGLNIF